MEMSKRLTMISRMLVGQDAAGAGQETAETVEHRATGI
jgi:hypothetical protein